MEQRRHQRHRPKARARCRPLGEPGLAAIADNVHRCASALVSSAAQRPRAKVLRRTQRRHRRQRDAAEDMGV
ncbi:hypothetical protein PV755_41210 [Streptomyces caniscabiei]|uniref:Uncharacterized protein n=1 Tax=Streptomyces caniscabiei TaxID=2746961 RepID=A0A927QJG7_9ACTN|nr:hypothetical protein [Streptomyces caniscabiei]MBD9729508.1 hypothetical protein [Streptomyces caniscabiei]MDX3515259.1 hypothetical protein [Streptomyces caniscabiei]MDX3724454.1 hypothetical protein [Streptomyces caniscabiei]MDX3732633.1 hypothetical protein [Streptomyces caniscabiei]WEO28946.1 hypothetical protein IHE65_40480 [Streptomyces caniscabiei]